MRRIEEPTRLLDPRSGASDDVRRLLAAGRDALAPTEDQLARLGAFAASAGTGGTLAAGKLAAGKAAAVRVGIHAITKVGVVKLAVVLAGGGIVAGVGWTELHRGEAPRTVPTVEVVPASSVAVPVLPPLVSPPQAQPVPADDTPAAGSPPSATQPPSVPSAHAVASPASTPAPTTPSPEVTTPSVPAGVSPVGGPAPSQAPAESELALLDRARATLAVDPAGAMRVLDEHRARFPGGAFAQEREVLAIEALVRLGRRQDAMARADAFARAFPGSAHRRRIAVLLGEDGGE
jgi:hypothetical protein